MHQNKYEIVNHSNRSRNLEGYFREKKTKVGGKGIAKMSPEHFSKFFGTLVNAFDITETNVQSNDHL
jgi:hypothetical protein